MKIFIYPNLGKTNCKQYVIDACNILNNLGCEIFLSNEYKNVFSSIDKAVFLTENECMQLCDTVVAVGGDGTILKCAKECSEYKKPILGINCGRLGFMASLEHTQIDKLERLVKGEFKKSRRMLISAVINENQLCFQALNDVVISKSDNCKIADFEVCRNGQLVSSLRADGIIFSTATGASAYSMSAGGPIIEPDMECIEFTQICPHSLFARTMIFSAESLITARCHTVGDVCTNVVVDGNQVYKMTQNDTITIKKSDKFIDIIDINGDSFFTSVNQKLMQPLKEFPKMQ